MVVLIDQSAESKGLSGTPVDTLTLSNRFLTSSEDFDNLVVEFTTVSREMCDVLSNSVESCKIDTSVISVIKLLVGLDLGPLFSHPLFFVEAESLALNVSFLHLLLTVVLNSLKLVLRDTLGDQLFTVLISDGLHPVDDLVHQGLGERGLIKFVMAEFPVAN